MENLFKNYYQLIHAAEECIKGRMTLPALILIYVAIDSVSWTASEDPEVATRFKKWVNTWMLKNGKLKCTAEELYAARCGVIHTLTPNSSLSERKGVKRIAYAWGKAKQDKLEETVSSLSLSNEISSIHLEDLFCVFKDGFADYLEHMFSSDEKREQFLKKAGQHFAHVEMEKMDAFLQITRNTKT
jgi:hypothetical protein